MMLLLLAAFHHRDLHLRKLLPWVRLELLVDDLLHGKHELHGVLVHLGPAEYRRRRNDLVQNVSVSVDQDAWHIHIQIVFYTLSCDHLDELDIGVPLGHLVENLYEFDTLCIVILI